MKKKYKEKRKMQKRKMQKRKGENIRWHFKNSFKNSFIFPLFLLYSYFISLDLLYFRSRSCNGFTPLCFFSIFIKHKQCTFTSYVFRFSRYVHCKGHFALYIFFFACFNSWTYVIKLCTWFFQIMIFCT